MYFFKLIIINKKEGGPLSVANYLTISRIFISPLFLIIYLKYESMGVSFFYLPYILMFLLSISELSDAFDGYIARKYNQVTDLGKILDPMADSIARISVFLTFTEGVIQLPMLLVFVLLYRDSGVSMLRTICALRGFALAARPSGKLKAVIQALAAFAIIILMIPYSMGKLPLETLQSYSFWIVFVACVYTIFSGIEYVYANREHIKKLLILPNKSSSPSTH
uniref:CDP-diacylglycerol--glycerol-3-phosphate 3-phosphatidyltransferase n=1 Tax=uncultured bacterium W5-77b TaxID=1131000 RepID=H9BWF9_9BACT|nr:CDP-diacylglycerol-glycerol-3-phosphate 3- phosphatidyltransferase [uncultured bacterium W5-77b]